MLVGLYDALHEMVAHDILLPNSTMPIPSTPLSTWRACTRPGAYRAREVDLGHVAGDYHLGVHAQSGEKHLNLVGGGVLGLVEHDDGVVECASAHECEGAIWITLLSMYSLSFTAGIISSSAS